MIKLSIDNSYMFSAPEMKNLKISGVELQVLSEKEGVLVEDSLEEVEVK